MALFAAVQRISLFVVLVTGLILATAAPVAASASGTELNAVLSTARSKVGAKWVHYAKGPDKFDCVGFVFYSFNVNGLKDRIGGYRGVRGYWNWFRDRGMISKSNGRPGDLIVWGKMKHIGINLGDGWAISALVNPYGVSVHKINRINVRFRGFLRVQLQR